MQEELYIKYYAGGKQMPLISIIVPAYNVEKYLNRCIDGILAQTIDNFEVILIDDGSSDRTLEICNYYARLDMRINVLHQNNQGVSAARNAGLDLAKGDFISFIDADDYVYSDYLEKMYSMIEKYNAEMCICGYLHFTGNIPKQECNNASVDIKNGRQMCGYLYDYNISEKYVIPWAKLYRKNLFDKVRFPVGKIHEDQFVTYQVYYYCSKVVELKDELYCYFTSPGSITRGGFSIKRYDNVQALEEAVHFYTERGDYDLAKQAEKLKKLFISMFAIYAREYGIYDMVDSRYRCSVFKAVRIIKDQLGYDQYEWFLYKIHPIWTKIQAKIRRILKKEKQK